MSEAALAAALAVFDEAALTLLSNKGTFRRAARDVEEGKVALASVDDAGAVISADGETVRIDGRGPAAARCSCPAPGICRHRVAAVLVLQAGAHDPVGESDAEDPREALLAEIAAIPEDALRRFAGRAGWRAAIELAEAGATVAAAGAALSIRLGEEGEEIRYLAGRGVDGMVSKLSPARRKAAHAAALIAARRLAGLEPEADSGATAPAAAQADEAIDPAFLAEVRESLAEACRSALSLAPVSVEERLFTLSVSSRADALPRLSAMLRGIARMVRERRTRGLGFDPDRCLGQIAAADALARALGAGDGDRLQGLRGVARQDYAECGPLRLRGMGAETWRSEAGSRGVTAYFYAAEPNRWFTVSLVRGAGVDPSFDPARAFRSEAVWGGHTLDALVRNEVRLTSVTASPGGRLSSTAGAAPELAPSAGIDPEWACLFGDWDRLDDHLRQLFAATLSASAPAMELVVLRPRRTATPSFDDLSQTLHVPVEDDRGRWTDLSLAHDPARTDRLEALTSLLDRGRPPAIVAAAEVAGNGFRLRPIAVEDDGALRSIDLDPVAKPGGGISAARLFSFLKNRPTAFVRAPASATTRLLAELRNQLSGIAELGGRTVSTGGDAQLRSLAGRASGAGLETLASAIEAIRSAGPAELAAAVLAARYKLDAIQARLLRLPTLVPGR